MDNRITRIAIDGPAAAGKSTVAKLVAENLSFVYVDTGAMYRAFTLKVIRTNTDINNIEAVSKLLENTNIELIYHDDGQKVLLDSQDVTNEIRLHEINQKVSNVAQIEIVRKEMVHQQQKLASNKSIVMDGRDIGTHVIPNAEIKIFLVASAEERGKRRHNENISKGITSNLNDIIREIEERDQIDYTRKISPLVKAKDAIEIDTTSLSIEEVVKLILTEVKKNL